MLIAPDTHRKKGKKGHPLFDALSTESLLTLRLDSIMSRWFIKGL